jgi:hypothetical protein
MQRWRIRHRDRGSSKRIRIPVHRRRLSVRVRTSRRKKPRRQQK